MAASVEKKEVKIISLKLENGDDAKFTLVGNAPSSPVYIMGGLAPFYLKGLTASGLSDNYILVAHDDPLWVRNKIDPIDEMAVKNVSLESIMYKEKLLVEALKKHFDIPKINIFGFSAFAALASEYALRYSGDVVCVVETGAGLCELDPTFKLTDEILKTQNPERYSRFVEAQKNHEKVLAGDIPPLPDANFVESDPEQKAHKRTLTPNSSYVQWVYSLVPKLAHADETEKAQKDAINHWHSTLIGHVICQPMREHFFTHIFSKLDPLALVHALEQAGIPSLFIQGTSDYITPLGEGVFEKFEQYKHVKLVTLSECGHMPYYEHPAYASVVNEFLTSIRPSITLSTPNPTAENIPTKAGIFPFFATPSSPRPHFLAADEEKTIETQRASELQQRIDNDENDESELAEHEASQDAVTSVMGQP